MGLSKQYLRYLPYAQFGLVGSSRCNVVFLSLRGNSARYIAAAACEHVNVWDIKTNRKVMTLKGEKAAAVVLAASPDGQHIAIGYTNGSIKVFSLLTSEMLITYNGHKSGVSCLSYESNGMTLCSGSNDGEVIVWDLVNESGLYKLKGHKDQVTCCQFIEGKGYLITSSKDSFVKWWDLATQHCFKTMVGHRAEVWAFITSNQNDMIMTGSSDSSLRVWDLKYSDSDEQDSNPSKKPKQEHDLDDSDDDIGESDLYGKKVTNVTRGSILREETDRVVSLQKSSDDRLIVCHGTGKFIELFKARSDAELKIYQRKKAKKLKRKLDESCQGSSDEKIETELDKRDCNDMFVHIGKFKTPGKVRSVDITKEGQCYYIACLLQNNQIIVKSTDLKLQKSELSALTKLHVAGHRSACKSMCFASDGLALLTTSANSVKLWNRVSQQCIQTCETDRGASCLFVPGDRQFLIGTINGKIEVHDVPAGKCVEIIDGHADAVSHMAMFSNKRGCASCSKDKSVKFWDFDLVMDEDFSKTTKRLSLTHSRTLQLDEEVTVVEFSPNGRLVACALLNCTVQLFYVDTLKFFLSLYGHSLPVTSISISTDSSLIATGSVDRNIKLWGLDFGDCHKSIFAHDDNITGVKFVPNTHLLFSSGKDGTIKQWDGDKFLHIQTLEGHIGGVSCLAIDNQGDYVMSSGIDMSFRLWSRSNEIVIPDEEQENAHEAEDEERLVKNLAPSALGDDEEAESGRVNKPTIESVKGAESIMEAIELYRNESNKSSEDSAQKHPILMAYGNISSDRYVLEILRKVRSSELEESLLVLPFSYVPDLFKLLNKFVSCSWETELSCRCLLFLLKLHHKLISTNDELLPILEHLQQNSESSVEKLQDTIGFNLAYLMHMKREMESKNEVSFFEDATDRFQQKKRKRKKKTEHAVLSL